MQQATDFRAECDALKALIAPLKDADFEKVTAFKDWTINDVMGHLHMWNRAAERALNAPEEFQEMLGRLLAFREKGGDMPTFEREWRGGIAGRELADAWAETYAEVADVFAEADPSKRVPWGGPSMSARSSISARLMETWAHGQEVYDVLGVVRQNADRIRNIVVLGVNTFGWTYACREETPPGPMPFVKLTAPSGEIWTYGEELPGERIEGLAEEFCQVVTQVRNIADTSLQVTGPVATDWMSKAQCFAGAASPPPAPGTRRTAKAA
ncbi:MAG: TIGR03084 family metal-binding protein [Minwuia sp.]|uniref:TIGR03084 family metal-binding protein n=1 Tax=Minwuia sp. TaxID=2493630 RepID=UPI003A859F24